MWIWRKSFVPFFRYPLTRCKIDLPNQNFYQSSYSKRFSEKNLKRNLCIECEENRSVFKLLSSSFQIWHLVSRFLSKPAKLICTPTCLVLQINFGCSIFFAFWILHSYKIPYTHAYHTQRQISKNSYFKTQAISKHVSQGKTRYWNFCFHYLW